MTTRQNTSGSVTTMRSRCLAREIAEMAGVQRRLGLMDAGTYEQIMARYLGEKVRPIEAPK